MKINWKLRLKNKTTLIALIFGVVDVVFSLLTLFNIVPSFSKETIYELISTIIGLLVLLGVVVDPTTEGIGDSEKALTYDNPKLNIPDLEHTNNEYKG